MKIKLFGEFNNYRMYYGRFDMEFKNEKIVGDDCIYVTRMYNNVQFLFDWNGETARVFLSKTFDLQSPIVYIDIEIKCDKNMAIILLKTYLYDYSFRCLDSIIRDTNRMDRFIERMIEIHEKYEHKIKMRMFTMLTSL